MEIANETLPKSIEAKEFSALFCRDRHASGTHIVFEWMFRKKRSTGSNKRSGYHPKSVCIGRGTIFNSLCESSVGVFYGDAAELDGKLKLKKNMAFTTKTGEIVSPFITSQPMITARAAFFSLLTATPANGARTTRRSLQGTALSSRKRKRIPICSEHRVMSNIAHQILCWQKPISLLLHSKTSLSPISMQPVRP